MLKRHKNVDLVLLDLSMPRMSGEEVLAELRYSRPELKVVLFTGYAAHGGDFPGAAAVVQKSFQLEELAAEMRLVLEG